VTLNYLTMAGVLLDYRAWLTMTQGSYPLYFKPKPIL